MVISNTSRAPKLSASDVVAEPEYEMINVVHSRNTTISMTPNPAYDVSTAVSRTKNPAYTASAAHERNDGNAYEVLDKTDRI